MPIILKRQEHPLHYQLRSMRHCGTLSRKRFSLLTFSGHRED